MLRIPESHEVRLISSEIITAPSSIVSECSPRPRTPRFDRNELMSFSEEYDGHILQVIHVHLELDSHHQLAYIGPIGEDMVTKIEKKFCLLNPVTVLYPGGVTYKDINDYSRRLAIKLASTGAEDFFAEASGSDPKKRRRFDRIFINNSIQELCDYSTVFTQMKKCLNKCGKILILHRAASITTLPFFNKAKKVLSDAEIPFMDIITALQRTGCEVQWDLEHIPIITTKMKWVAMLRNRYPVQLEIMSDAEVEAGVRELLTGQLNYLTEEIEIDDRLILITGSPPDAPEKFSPVQRIVSRPQLPYSSLLDGEYELTLTEPMKKILDSISKSKLKS